MATALLIVPHFWDPVCVPLGVSSLKAYAEAHGHTVRLLDVNGEPAIFGLQHQYFQEVLRQFPRWRNWNVQRNGTEVLALHQIAFLSARSSPRYREIIAEILNVREDSLGQVVEALDVERFDQIFTRLYSAVGQLVSCKLAETRPDVVGCSIFNSTWAGTLFVTNLAKRLLPHARTVVGGPGPLMGITSEGAEVQRFYDAHGNIDYFVVGEGESPFLNILENAALPHGILCAREPGRRGLDFNSLPTPDYGELPVERYLQLSVASSRGCPFECSFCAETVFWNGYRKARTNQTYLRMNDLAERYRRHSFYVCDSLSNAVIGPLTEEIQRNGKPFNLDCYLRADKSCVDARKAAEWRAGGLYRARLGMESASQRILDEMVKMTTPDLMSRSLHALSNSGIMTSTLWIICYPGETESEFQQTLDFIRAHRDQIYQADAWVFQYHQQGLSKSNLLNSLYGSRERFSPEVNSLLHVTPFVVERDVSAAERFDRLERFVLAMRELEIPNPYSLFDWVGAERRWRELGRDAGWNVEQSMLALNS
ncbi:MAG: radical SAM protein [Pseudomonadota bacterium]|nr:radical SAM protein [Pseudomonadota bacterium]